MTTLWDELYPDYALDVFVEEVQAKIPSLQQTYAIDTTDEAYGKPFLFYLLFTHWPSLLDLTPQQAFYNRYYWFRRFMGEYERVKGKDVGLEQQTSQMLEHAPSDVDWELISLIEARARPLGPNKTHPEVFWIDGVEEGRLGIMARPRGGDWLDGEIRSLAKAGVNVLVSLLTADEAADLQLQDEERLCTGCGVRFISFPISDRRVPFSLREARHTIDLILGTLRAGKTVAIHCRMGIGRSALIAACLLKSQGIGVDGAFAMISRARGFAVPDTGEQKEWVRRFTEES
jgi:protein-tyrosine phosphatase